MKSILQSFLWFNFLSVPQKHLGDMRIFKSSDDWTHFTLHLCSKYKCFTCWICKKQSKSESIIIQKFIECTMGVVLVCYLPQCRVQQPWTDTELFILWGRRLGNIKWGEYNRQNTLLCDCAALLTFFPSFPAFILPLALTPPHSIALVCCSYLDLDQSETVDIHALGLLWNKVLNAHLCNNPHFRNTCMITWKSPGLFSMSSYQ